MGIKKNIPYVPLSVGIISMIFQTTLMDWIDRVQVLLEYSKPTSLYSDDVF